MKLQIVQASVAILPSFGLVSSPNRQDFSEWGLQFSQNYYYIIDTEVIERFEVLDPPTKLYCATQQKFPPKKKRMDKYEYNSSHETRDIGWLCKNNYSTEVILYKKISKKLLAQLFSYG